MTGHGEQGTQPEPLLLTEVGIARVKQGCAHCGEHPKQVRNQGSLTFWACKSCLFINLGER